MDVMQQLRAQAEISRLLYSYAYHIDSGDFDAQAELFRHATVSAGAGREMFGADAFRAMERAFVRTYDDGTPRTKHVITNVIVDVAPDGASASSRCYFQVLQAAPGFALQPICAGRYEDRFECVDGVWRFSRREMRVDLAGDLSAHLLKAQPT